MASPLQNRFGNEYVGAGPCPARQLRILICLFDATRFTRNMRNRHARSVVFNGVKTIQQQKNPSPAHSAEPGFLRDEIP